ncbi:hypothetical protein SAMN04488118_104226 [Epibacterium ulvae]|uniref:Uncharacterized protein n=1 Tax=Epibacterium ulvae TaxID=1156985 RepID=A0A1G5QIE9_9RHOB|nr:hypothetical protein SAMN04488118_104226 [Epibacterium ulvae]
MPPDATALEGLPVSHPTYNRWDLLRSISAAEPIMYDLIR